MVQCTKCYSEHCQMRTVQKEGPTKGRGFWICQSCNTWIRWAHPSEGNGGEAGQQGGRPSAPARQGPPGWGSLQRPTSPPKPVNLVDVELASLIPATRFALVHGYRAELIDAYKTRIPADDRMYDPDTKRWIFPLSAYDDVAQVVQSFPGSKLTPLPSFLSKGLASPAVHALLQELRKPATVGPILDGRLPSRLLNTLMPYQIEGVKLCIRRSGRALLGDEMGLGKTLQAIGVAAYYKEHRPILICVPAGLRFQWREKVLELMEDEVKQNDICVLKAAKDSLAGQVVIASYDLVAKLTSNGQIKPGQYKVVIADESHSLKSPDAQRTKALLPLLQKAPVALCLSGTPAVNRPAELFTQLNALQPTLFPEWHSFTVRYCNGRQGQFGWDASGSSHEAELRMLLETLIMIRRLKKDVLSDGPLKQREYVKVELAPSVLRELEEAMKEKESFERQSKSAKGDDADIINNMLRAAMNRAYSLTGAAKVKGALDYIERNIFPKPAGVQCDLERGATKGCGAPDADDDDDDEDYLPQRSIGPGGVVQTRRPALGRKRKRVVKAEPESFEDEEGGEQGSMVGLESQPMWPKVIFFCHHKQVMTELEAGLKAMGVKLIRIDGDCGPQKRDDLQRRFQEDPSTHAAVLSITACSTGLNFTSASMACFIEVPWVPGLISQAEDRIHRLGQTASVVRYVYMIADGTMDKQMWQSMGKKEAVLSNTTGLGEDSRNDWSTLQARPYIAPMPFTRQPPQPLSPSRSSTASFDPTRAVTPPSRPASDQQHQGSPAAAAASTQVSQPSPPQPVKRSAADVYGPPKPYRASTSSTQPHTHALVPTPTPAAPSSAEQAMRGVGSGGACSSQPVMAVGPIISEYSSTSFALAAESGAAISDAAPDRDTSRGDRCSEGGSGGVGMDPGLKERIEANRRAALARRQQALQARAKQDVQGVQIMQSQWRVPPEQVGRGHSVYNG